MKLKCFESDDLFLIYREKYGVFLYIAAIGLFTFALGGIFAFVVGTEQGQLPLKIFGWVFLFAGAFAVFSIKRVAAATYKDLGLPVLLLSNEKLIVNPGIGTFPTTYQWHQVSKIVITSVLFSKDMDGPVQSKNMVVIFFNPATLERFTFSNLNRQRSVALDGSVYTELAIPKHLSIQQAESAILKVCPLAKVETMNELRLN